MIPTFSGGRPTLRQWRTAVALLKPDRRDRPTQTELARTFGVSQAAISKRLMAFRARLTAAELAEFTTTPPRRKKRRIIPLQLNFADAI